MNEIKSKLKNYIVFKSFFAFLFYASFIIIFNFPLFIAAQENDYEYFQNNFLKYGDYVYKSNIKTVLFHKQGFDLSPPLIRFGSKESLVLRFDDLDADYKNYYYTIIHCNADWQPSQLNNYEYIEGFYDDQIRDYKFSVNTIVDYTHYYLEFPNRNIQPKVSGNYILKVFLNGDPEDIVLTRKFKVFEQLVAMEGTVRQATRVSFRDEKQEVNFSINASAFRIRNPYQDLKITIKQNGRTDNLIWDLKPSLVMGDRLIYEYEDKNLFDGGNEFRRFDTRSLRFTTERVSDITGSHSHWEVYLLRDQRRSARRYTFDEDINGQYIIKNTDGYDSHTDADYAWVHFSLNYHIPEENGNFYIIGDLSDWNYTSDNRMKYSFREKEYHTSMFLKQGYYNYLYVFLEDGSVKGQTYLAEGNHSEAENDYTIFAYYRKPGMLYDSLIGVLHLNSGISK